MSKILPIALGLGFLVMVASGPKSKETAPKPVPPPPPTPVPDPPSGTVLILGDPKDPDVAATLLELENFLISEGVPRRHWSAIDLTTMWSAPNDPVAVPIRDMWPNIVPALKFYVSVRDKSKGPMYITSGFRDPEYNEAVGGSEGSKHMDFAALDIQPELLEDKKLLAWSAVELWQTGVNMGLGVYGKPNSPRRAHVDFGFGRRKWADTGAWLSQA